MRIRVPSILTTLLLCLAYFFPQRATAQILAQDFESLHHLSQFYSPNNANTGQVNVVLESSTDGLTTFSLADKQGQKVLRLNKGSTNPVYWIKDQGFGDPPVLRLQFKLEVAAPPGVQDLQGVIGSFFIGKDLARNRNFPEHARRFTTLELAWESPSRFRIENRVGNVPNGAYSAAGGATISIVMNNSGAPFTYLAPTGAPEQIAHGRVDVWADQQLAMNDAAAQASAPLSEVKFVSRNNGLQGIADFDNLLIEAVPAYTPPPALNPAGGTYTLGPGGDFSSLTRPDGVFAALNRLGSASGPFVFEVIGDLTDETGAVALNQLAGASQQNSISIRPRDASRAYVISGSSTIATGALIRLNGADWVHFDGRPAGTTATGLQVPEGLVFRNTGTGPTVGFEKGATHNYLGYCQIEGNSADISQGVIVLNGEEGANSHITVEYNEIGGYGSDFPVNSIASHAAASTPNAQVVVQGNEFYHFGAKGSSTEDHPAELFLGPGSTGWTITDNHFYLRQGSFSTASPTIFSLRAIRITSGTGYTISRNHFGGQGPFAGGSPMHISTTSEQQGYASILPLSFEAPAGEALFQGNVIANITAETRAIPQQANALALSAVVYAGRVDFVENEFHTLTAISTGPAAVLQGAYAIMPIQFRNRPALSSSGSVVGNQVHDIRLEGSRSGAGGTYLTFSGIFVDTQASVAEIRDNRISTVEARVSGRLGADLIGIVYKGQASQVRIERNIICDLINTSTFGEAVAIDPLLFGSTGIYTEHVSGGLLLANNMLALTTPAPQSTSTLHGLYLNSSAPELMRVYHNTLYAYGPGNASARPAYLLRRGGSAPVDIKNNILLDSRATDQINYLLYSRLSAGFSSNHNLLYQGRQRTPYPDFAFIASNSAASLEEWQQMTLASSGQSQDLKSLSQNVEEYFVDPQACNLRILETKAPQSPTIDAGIEVAGVTTDIDQVVRITPDMGASEAYNAWIGAQDSRWDNPANWSRGAVPDCERNNMVGILPNGTQIYDQTVRHQPIITIPNAYYRNLVVLEQASVTIGSAVAVLQQCGLEDPALEGITNRGTITYSASGEIRLQGVLRNEGSWQSGRGMLSLNGTEDQSINSNTELQLWDLRLTGGGDKVLDEIAQLSIQHSLVLEGGILVSSEESLLAMGPAAQLAGTPSNSSHVAGPMLKQFDTTDEFVYPVGDEERLGRLAIIPAQNTPTTFLVQYHADPPPAPTNPAEFPAAFEEVIQVSEQEYWTVTRLSGSSAAQLALYWDEASGVEGMEEEDLVVARWSTSASRWINEGNEAIKEAPAPGLGILYSQPGLQEFGNGESERGIVTFGTPNPDAPLPVTLLSFTAELQESDVLLEWHTATEENNSHFLVQRSHNGKDYTTLGRLASKAPGGTSTLPLAYRFTDAGVAETLSGPLYYRLEQVDIDGTTTHSPVVLVQLPDPLLRINGVYPNPFSDNLVINVQGAEGQQLQLRLLQPDGRQLHRQQLQLKGGETILPVQQVQQLPAGVYVLEIRIGELTQYYRVVKN